MTDHEPQEGRSHDAGAEPEPVPYYRASRFSTERPAGQAYRRIRNLIYGSEQELSVFRFQLSSVYHVAVIGNLPPEPLEQRLRRALAAGVPVQLSADILEVLYARRAMAQQQGSWVERQYRPGQSL